MPIDRRRLLLQRSNAAAAMNRDDLPPHIRQAYQKARDSADMALGLQDAKARAQAKAKLLGGALRQEGDETLSASLRYHPGA